MCVWQISSRSAAGSTAKKSRSNLAGRGSAARSLRSADCNEARAVWTCGKLFTKTTTRSRSTQLNCGTFCLRGPIFLPPASPNNFASQATVWRHQFPPAAVLRKPRRRSPVQQHQRVLLRLATAPVVLAVLLRVELGQHRHVLQFRRAVVHQFCHKRSRSLITSSCNAPRSYWNQQSLMHWTSTLNPSGSSVRGPAMLLRWERIASGICRT